MGAPPKVPIVGVPATSGGRWVREEMEGDSDIFIEDVCMRGWYVKSRCGTSVDAHGGSYFVW